MYAALLMACSRLNLTLAHTWPIILSPHQSPSKPHVNIDKTSILWGPILNSALVLGLLKREMLIFFF